MKLHIANCSPQRHLFNYKLPERRQPFARHIPAGDQITLEVQDTDITAIIDQHERYGFVDVTKIPKDFSGICYSIDREIKVSKIKDGYEARIEFLDDRAEKIIEESAVVINNGIKNAAVNHGQEQQDGFEMSINSEPLDPEQDDKSPVKKNVKVTK
ncbi:hypothetical protein [Serratia oryzae]|uniref:Uncharacterized protein n=1 Tax=Serratia oryzae TaxID=2034155 RepID=A0A1S8CP76_9GAMM|nr:hypothetical protein [Serratia oryzae]OMQ26902.1 hypothetical protein BMI79_00820 [Serratia oryzae]